MPTQPPTHFLNLRRVTFEKHLLKNEKRSSIDTLFDNVTFASGRICHRTRVFVSENSQRLHLNLYLFREDTM